jgi:hypothetical protein
MNFDKLIPFVVGVVMCAAVAGQLDRLEIWIFRAQAQVLYESRASNWGSPRVFKETNSSKSL